MNHDIMMSGKFELQTYVSTEVFEISAENIGHTVGEEATDRQEELG